jgi:hypothetical protein
LLASSSLAVLLAGSRTSAALDSAHIGMTKADVQPLPGTPESASVQADVECMRHNLTSEAGYGRDQPHMVLLVNGKVEFFG